MAQIVAARMVRALVRLGWVVARQKGSHAVLVKAGRPQVAVPMHRGSTLREGTAKQILKDAGVPEDEFFKVY